jgi:PAS domain S-box-containing protein
MLKSIQAQLYTYTKYGHKQGLQMSSVRALTQSEDGMLWIGTDGSELFNFDGKEFSSFEGNEKFLFHHTANFYSSDDQIYVASRYQGFFKVDPKKNTLSKVTPPTKLKGESHVYFENNGYAVFSTPCGIAIGSGKDHSYKKDFYNCDLQITDVINTADKSILLTNKGVFVTNGTGLITLRQWLNKDLKTSDFQFGYHFDSRIALFDSKAENWLEIVLDDKGKFFSISEYLKTSPFQEGDSIVAFDFNMNCEIGAAVSSSGDVYSINGLSKNEFKYQIKNSDENIDRPACLLVDKNGSIWIGSMNSGLYKLSKEPFTKLKILELYKRNDIALPYKTKNNEILISLFSNETHVLSQYGTFPSRKYNFTINSIASNEEALYLATNRGLKYMRSGEKGEITDLFFTNKNLTLVFQENNKLFVGIAGEGLLQLRAVGNSIQIVDTIPLPNNGEYIYTAQSTSNERAILFGTNDGIALLNLDTKKTSLVPIDYEKWGSYSGVSTKDAYGKCWFTLDRAIVCIDKRKVVRIIDATKYFKTNLLYTLVGDIYGNLYVGTNKGVFRVKIDRAGNVIEITQYEAKLGFEGYETNMRSQFIGEDAIYIGTVEGLFQISPELFERFPIPSNATIKNLQVDNENSKWFRLSINNPKTSEIKYIYRLKGRSDKWISLDTSDQIRFSDLSNGKYTLEVKASYDGIEFSKPSFHKFEINRPIWKSSIFVIIIIALIVGLNILLIRYNKAFDTTSLLDSKDTVIHLKMTPGILIFGFITVSAAHILAPILDTDLVFHAGPTLFTSFMLLSLFLLSLSSKSNGTEKQYFNTLLMIGLIIVQVHFLYELFVSDLHPFHIIGIVLVSMIVPYVLTELKQTVIYSILLLAVSLIFIKLIEHAVYSKVYFLIAIFVLSCLLIFISYLRYNSLEKLLFISGIVNKGNLPAIAFDKNGVIQYVSENISMFADIRHDKLLKRNISYLNNFVPFDEKYKETDVLREFEDGSKYLVPMRNVERQVRWVEWSYKQFTEELRVMIGQDVTERMELENTYELLVQNAEDFIYRCDVDGNFTFLNDISFEKLGYSKDELIGKSSVSIIDEAFKNEVQNYYNDHFVQRKTTSYREFPIRTKEGALIWVGQYVTTLFTPGSDSFVRGFIALARDITEIRTQQELIIDQRDNITASIHYAKRIQQNLLPHERMFANLFEDHFILYKPKDIVSGDFFWLEDTGDKLILALADCTGHGVPGSFMTLLGVNLLKTILVEDRIYDPGKILDKLDERLLEILPRGDNDSQVKDGMEITICAIDKYSNDMSFACAGSRFLIYRNSEFTMYKGDNKHIGDIHFDGFQNYQTNFLTVEKNDQLFLFTDGFQDQFGGPNDKKYSFRRLLEVFEDGIDRPLSDQKSALEHEFKNWIGFADQTDDLTIISVRKK